MQQHARRELHAPDFGKLKPRNPFKAEFEPHESRFEAIKGNPEALSKHRNTRGSPDFNSYPYRPEIWGPPKPQPKVNDYDLSVIQPKTLKQREFSKQGEGHQNVFRVKQPIEVDSEKVTLGLEKTRLKQNKPLFNMETSAPRTNIIFNLDPEYI